MLYKRLAFKLSNRDGYSYKESLVQLVPVRARIKEDSTTSCMVEFSLKYERVQFLGPDKLLKFSITFWIFYL